jgi:protein kinase A
MPEKKKIDLKEYEVLQTLGTGNSSYLTNYLGSFGRVRLVRNKKTGKYYALKMLKKSEILRLKQVDHVLSEINILSLIDHSFIVIK